MNIYKRAKRPMKPSSCCPDQSGNFPQSTLMSRIKFIKITGGSFLSVANLSGLLQSALAGSPSEERYGLIHRSLVIKPILLCSPPAYRHQAIWKAWGEIQTDHYAHQEIGKIQVN